MFFSYADWVEVSQFHSRLFIADDPQTFLQIHIPLKGNSVISFTLVLISPDHADLLVVLGIGSLPMNRSTLACWRVTDSRWSLVSWASCSSGFSLLSWISGGSVTSVFHDAIYTRQTCWAQREDTEYCFGTICVVLNGTVHGIKKCKRTLKLQGCTYPVHPGFQWALRWLFQLDPYHPAHQHPLKSKKIISGNSLTAYIQWQYNQTSQK